MKQNNILLLPIFAVILVVMTGCPYEAHYTLIGEPAKYAKHVPGSYHSGKTELKLAPIDEYSLKAHYDDNDEADHNIVDGTVTVVQVEGSQYMVFKADGKDSYFIAKVIRSDQSQLLVNIIDEKAIPSGHTISSSKDLTQLVVAKNKELFPGQEKTLFKRDK